MTTTQQALECSERLQKVCDAGWKAVVAYWPGKEPFVQTTIDMHKAMCDLYEIIREVQPWRPEGR